MTGLVFGQTLSEFDVNLLDFDAHVAMTGDLTTTQRAIQSIAGAGLPLLIWLVFIGWVPRKASFPLEILKLLSTMAVLNTLLAWIVIPILYLVGKAPADDVIHFLQYSQMPPLLLTVMAVCFYGIGWIFFLAKIDGLRNEFLLFRTIDRQTLAAGAQPTIAAMAGFLVVCVILTFTFNRLAMGNPWNRLSPPQGFEPVAQIDLSTRDYSEEALVQFSVDTAREIGIFVVVRNIDTTYFDLSVVGPDGYRSIVLHGEGYWTDRDGGLWEETLAPGTYQLVLTSHQSPGTVSVSMKDH